MFCEVFQEKFGPGLNILNGVPILKSAFFYRPTSEKCLVKNLAFKELLTVALN